MLASMPGLGVTSTAAQRGRRCKLALVLVLAVLSAFASGCSLTGGESTENERAGTCPEPRRKFVRQAWATSGEISDIAVSCNTIYVAAGGSIGPRTGPLAAVTARTGQRLPMPELSGEVGDVTGATPLVQAMVDDGQGGWFVGGAFAFAGDRSCPGVVHVKSDGRLDIEFCPRTDGPIHAMTRLDGSLYIAGQFTHVGGQRRGQLAAIDVSTGTVLPWAPRLDPALTCPDRDEPGVLISSVAALTSDSTAVYVGGFFSGVNGTPRPGLVALDPESAAMLAFDAEFSAADCGRPAVTALLATESGLVVAGGEGDDLRVVDATTGRDVGPRLPDLRVTVLAASGPKLYAGGYFGAAAFDLRSGDRLPWRPRIAGDLCCYEPGSGVHSILPIGDVVYIGGNFARAGGARRAFVAAVDESSGEARQWDPRPNGPVLAMGRSGNRVLLGGTLSGVSVESRNGLAAIDGPSGRLLPWAPRVVGRYGPGGVNALTVADGRLYAGGNFKQVDGQPRRSLAAFDLTTGHLNDWSPAIGGDPTYGVTVLASFESVVYAGGDYSGAASGLDEQYEPRVGVAALDARTGKVAEWNPKLHEESGLVHVKAIAVTDHIVYLGGDFDTAGADGRGGLVAVERDSAGVTAWDPAPEDLSDVNAIAVGSQGVYVGGSFTTIGTSARSALALVNTESGAATPFDADLNGFEGVEVIGLRAGQVFVAGDFTRVRGAMRAGLAAIGAVTGNLLPWNPAPRDRARYRPDSIAVGGDAVIVDGYIQGNGEQLVVHTLGGR